MIHRKFLECDVVDICNLSCKSCGHASPYYKKNYYTFDKFSLDVQALSKVFHAEHFVILGGEPLILGEKLRDYIRVIRESGICNKIKLLTNGILAHRYTDILFLCDIVCVSIYDHQHRSQVEQWANEKISEFHERGIEFYPEQKRKFAEVLSTERLTEERAEESWVKCGAKTWCNQLYDGYYYLCGPIAKFHRVLEERGIKVEKRGCSIHDPELEERLALYLASNEKQPMCFHCLGHLNWHPWQEEKVK